MAVAMAAEQWERETSSRGAMLALAVDHARFANAFSRHRETRSLVAVEECVVTARFSVSRRTLDRWMRDVLLGFPRPLLINHRLCFSLARLAAQK